MSDPGRQSGFGSAIFFVVFFGLGLYFTFASVQGDYGLFRRVQINAEAQDLTQERGQLMQEIAALSNKTLRLSDEYLDLDLLDQQARDVLGMVRANEVVIR